MADPTSPSDDRIQDLERRLEADPSSRLFLQLAEEYRRKDRLEDAVGVLEKGLQAHPNHPSAKVALGRCQLALGRAEAAAALFAEVLSQDPTQMVANKLLVEAYLDLGRLDLADQSLRDYRQLNPGDPEIEALQERLSSPPPAAKVAAPGAGEVEADPLMDLELEVAQEPALAAEEPFADVLGDLPTGSGPAEAPPPSAEEAGDDPLFDLDLGVSASSDLDLGSSLSLEEPAGTTVEASPEEPAPEKASAEEAPAPASAAAPAGPGGPTAKPEAAEGEGEDPFGGLFAGGERDRITLAAEAEDLLGDLLGIAPESAPAVAAPAPAPKPAMEPAPAATPAAPEAVGEAKVPTPQAPEVASAAESAAPPVAPSEAAPVAPAGPSAKLGDDEPTEVAIPRRKEPTATLTLGRLYMQQGHREEAERVFLEVLERDPGNASALEALAELAKRDQRRAAAAQAPPAEPAPQPEVPELQEEARAEAPVGEPEVLESVAEEPGRITADLTDLEALESAEASEDVTETGGPDLGGGITARRIAALSTFLRKLQRTDTHVS